MASALKILLAAAHLVPAVGPVLDLVTVAASFHAQWHAAAAGGQRVLIAERVLEEVFGDLGPLGLEAADPELFALVEAAFTVLDAGTIAHQKVEAARAAPPRPQAPSVPPDRPDVVDGA